MHAGEEKMSKFVKAGSIVKRHDALEIQIDGRDQPLYISARDVARLLTEEKKVSVQKIIESKKTPGEVVILDAGEAWISRSGRAVNIWVAGEAPVMLSTPREQVLSVRAGTRASAVISMPQVEEIIDAGAKQQKKPAFRRIDEGLNNTF